ncbi:DUF1540 domain-containing protein [Desulfofundulus salinus]|uniref:DUF1540 domain-containing protein n=1 Tax=Desulfofundulus salinus TaxID=2419843 RepID=A0A494WQU7_9FIRM|nr:DUF1540 domain-containing protein [Desulfofundulus salinum]RKO65519.1 DUF1540 domain-containing protein [Desulfofundulus salinum]
MPQQIKCSVSECQYNSDLACDAPMVQVDRNGVSKASNSPQTKCETFKPRG